MSAQDNLSKVLFHGTRAIIKGKYIVPKEGVAWATSSKEAAAEYGKTKLPKGKIGPLTIYHVEPSFPDEVVEANHPYMKDVKNYGSHLGFKIVGKE